MSDPLEDETHRAPRTRRELRADREDVTRVVARRPTAGTAPVAVPGDEDETLLADRRTDDPTRTTKRPGPPRATTGGTPIAHGRADTPRTASPQGTLVPQSVYGPRRTGGAAPVVRSEVSPPTPVRAAPPRRRHGGALLWLIALAGAAVVAAAVWGIIVIVQGGFG